jgi:hypothetical protein
VYVTTRWEGAWWTRALCRDFTSLSVDVWLHVLSSDHDSAEIGELQYVMRPDEGGYSMFGPQISLWDTQGTEVHREYGGWYEELGNPTWVSFDINTRFHGRTFAVQSYVAGGDYLDSEHCGQYLYVLARMVD